MDGNARHGARVRRGHEHLLRSTVEGAAATAFASYRMESSKGAGWAPCRRPAPTTVVEGVDARSASASRIAPCKLLHKTFGSSTCAAHPHHRCTSILVLHPDTRVRTRDTRGRIARDRASTECLDQAPTTGTTLIRGGKLGTGITSTMRARVALAKLNRVAQSSLRYPTSLFFESKVATPRE